MRRKGAPIAGSMAAVILMSGIGTPAGAQEVPPPVFNRPYLQWQTLRTDHFEVHFPAEMAVWATAVTGRLESVRTSVEQYTGYAPQRLRVVIDDTGYFAGGMSFPVGGLVFLWPQPHQPLLGSAHERPEVLLVHELTHPADSPPSRNVWDRLWRTVIPPPWNVSPRGLTTPRWVSEGHASHAEGRVAGGGLPHTAMRAAFLRQWSLEDRMPAYGELNRGGLPGYPVPYGVGSAFFDWLVEQHGEAALRALWRRRADPDAPSLEAAFTDVFGAAPPALYAAFTANARIRALEVRARLAASGIVEGEALRPSGSVSGRPAISPDGGLLAVAVPAPGAPARIAVHGLGPSGTLEERPRAELPARQGRSFSEPRFMPDGREILLVHRASTAGGSLRGDIYLWDWEGGTVRRVTRGAGIMSADPAPSGTHAVADRCLAGTCDVVIVDLATGQTRVIAHGTPFVTYSRPRWSPTGRAIAVARNDHGRWHVVISDEAGHRARAIGSDDGVDRYQPAFTPDGSAVVVVSERDGMQNLARIDIDSGRETLLTRVTGAAVAPSLHPEGDVIFLLLRGEGLVLARLPPSEIQPQQEIAIPPALAPALPPARHPKVFGVDSLDPPRAYGMGPRAFGVLPIAGYQREASWFGFAITNTDPIGRLTVLFQSLATGAREFGGAALGVTYRGLRPTFTADLFDARIHSGMGPDDGGRYRGVALLLTHTPSSAENPLSVRAGISHGTLLQAFGSNAGRTLGFLEGRVAAHPFTGRSIPRIEAYGHVGGGVTDAVAWQRVRLAGSARVWGDGQAVDIRLALGGVSHGAPQSESFILGGTDPLLFDAGVLSQRVSMPVRAESLPARRFVNGRIAVVGWPVEPYLWTAWHEVSHRRPSTTIGIERIQTAPHVPFARMPGMVRAHAGLGYSLTGDSSRRLSAFAHVLVRP